MIQSVDARMVAAMNLFDGKLALRGSAGIWSQFSTRTHYRHLNAFRGSLSAVAMLGSFRIRGEYSTPSEQLTSYSDCKVKTPSAYSVGASWHKANGLGAQRQQLFPHFLEGGKHESRLRMV